MKKIFKVLVLGMALLITFGLVGCGGSSVVFSKNFANGNEGTFLKMADSVTITDNTDGTITIGKCADTEGAYTKLGEYRSEFPTKGFVVTLEVFIDLENMTQNELMTYTAAINNTEGTYLTETGIMIQKDGAQLVIHSPNFKTDKTVGYEDKTTRVNEGGWLKINTSFYPNGNKLNSKVVILNSENEEIHASTWEPHAEDGQYDITLTECGGNRYAWVNQVAIDDGLKLKSVELRNID